MSTTTLGIDLAKNTFSLHGVDAHGKAVLRKTLKRDSCRSLFTARCGFPEGAEQRLPEMLVFKDVYEKSA